MDITHVQAHITGHRVATVQVGIIPKPQSHLSFTYTDSVITTETFLIKALIPLIVMVTCITGK